MIELLEFLHKRIVTFHKDENVSYEKKNFYLVMTCAVPILLIVGFLFLAKSKEPMLSASCFMMTLFIFVIAAASDVFKVQIVFSYLFCIVMTFFFVPIIFFMNEGVFYGMTLFFVLNVILTIILLGRQKFVNLFVFVEILYDMLLVIYVYFKKDKVYLEVTTVNQEIAISLSFVLVACAVIFLFNYQNYIHREIRNTIQKDRDSIIKAENTKGRFLANMTHEIRTPMNAIVGMTDLILKENLDRNVREHVDTIKNASSLLLKIINNILEFSKLDSGRAEIINNEYSFRKMIEEIVSGTAKNYYSENIDIHIFLSKDIPDKLFGDEVRIKQVLRQLLYSPLFRNVNGTVNLIVDGDYDTEKCVIKLKFRIASTGRGLTKDEIAAIYNAYSSYDSRQKTDYNRAGLEFSICKQIINMMDGDIEIESIEGIGNAVEFSFDNYVVDEKPIVDFKKDTEIYPLIYLKNANTETEHAWQNLIEEFKLSATYVKTPISFRGMIERRNFTSIYIPDSCYEELKEYIEAFDIEDKVYIITSTKHSIGDFGKCRILRHPIYIFNFLESINGEYDADKYNGMVEQEEVKYPYARILCVDDTSVNLTLLNNILKGYEISATLCKSGKEALEALEKEEFDLFLIDHKMPGMDGVELLKHIKELGNANSTAPAICVTADLGSDIKSELEKAGFDEYLAKPINITYLDRTLKQFLPEELSVVKKVLKKEVEKKVVKDEQAKPELDPRMFDPSIGIKNLGGSKEAYISVLLAYYEEGVNKLNDVPKQFADGDISLYTTNVHALKSSSATVGCMGISPLFKELEFAGKENNTELIKNNSPKAFEYFVDVLESVRKYLEDEGALTENDENNAQDDGEVVEIDKELLNELSSCVMSMNLRRCEEIINILCSNNYGSEINEKVKSIRNNYDNFEYFEIKTVIEELL